MMGEILQTFNATSVSSNGEMHLGCSSGAFPVADSWQSLSSTSLVPMAAPSWEPLNPSRSQVMQTNIFSYFSLQFFNLLLANTAGKREGQSWGCDWR